MKIANKYDEDLVVKSKLRVFDRFWCWMTCALPVVLFFSYYPVITLGGNETMNFELSLPIIWLVGFDVCLVVAVSVRKKWGKVWNDIRGGWRWLVFPLFVTLSVLWSENVVRGVLTCGIMWCVVVAIYGLLMIKKVDAYNERVFGRVFYKVFFGASLLACAWCVVQCVMDVMGVSSEYTLMCRGCVTQMFGFPHPNGFAIEPQFMGNLLLAPAIATAAIIVGSGAHILSWVASGRSIATGGRRSTSRCRAPEVLRKNNEHHPLKLYALFFVFAATLFLTFSRGAIYAFVVGLIFMSTFFLVREKRVALKRVGAMWGVTIVAFLFTLNVQGILTAVGPTNDTYFDGAAKVMNHLSLGIIDVRGTNDVTPEGEVEVVSQEAVFDGYVEESTNIRMELTRDAFSVWSWDFRTMLVGVGIGGAGQAMYDRGLTDSPKEIIQNEYASLLAETGVVGVVLCGWLLVMVVKTFMKGQGEGMLLAMLVAYGVSLMFFSGLANALQIYLMPAVMYVVVNLRSAKSSHKSH